MANGPPRLRAAIYTRKSTEEGLDKAFNSLDAQREACAAYVMSQRHEGWVLLPDFYDDGGFSGGNMDRPGLKQLLGEVRAGRVDVVVVYKIDRLTRSLTDFSKIVEVLDDAGTSFVSVTQAFNTTNSMGRLTLNVLLAFAQFEREVIAERIRDKVAASKARGMWMGGTVPLGYRVENRKLVIVPQEAATVREIMERYTRSGSVRELLIELRHDGIVSKQRVGRDGSPKGGHPILRGALYGILANRTYVGETTHKDKIYNGEHEAIVSRELFDAVQVRLAERTNPRSANCSRKPVSMLTGRIFDSEGRPMSPYHTFNHGRRYAYYASNRNDNARTPAQRLPAGELESSICRVIAQWLSNASNTRELQSGLGTHELTELVEGCRSQALELTSTSLIEARLILQRLDLQVEISGTGIKASFDASSLLVGAHQEQETGPRIELAVATSAAAYGHEPRLRLDPPAGLTTPRDERLVELITRAFASRDRLLAMTDDEVGSLPPVSLRHLERTARLSYLEPAIVHAVLEGTQPRSLSARTLSRMGALPLSWVEQRGALGFAPA